MKTGNYHVIEQVPPDYYQSGVKNNFLQKLWHTKKLQAVLLEIDKKPSTVLDVGCASGWFLSEIAKKFRKAECFGVDIYDNAIAYGKKMYPKMYFKKADAHKLPFKKESFDLIICTEVLEHMGNPETALQEIKRVLKKDGRAIIELDSGSLLFSVVWYFWRLSRGGVWKDAHLHSFNVPKLEKMLKRVGFKIINKRQFNLGMAMVFSVEKA